MLWQQGGVVLFVREPVPEAVSRDTPVTLIPCKCRHAVLRARLCVLWVLVAALGIQARDLYVSPSGTPSGPGTIAEPYDLATAVSGQVVRPGDTFWLRGGNYVIGHVNTTIGGAPGQPVTFRQLPGEQARIDGSLTFWGQAGHVVLRDFELYSSDTNRLSTQTNVGISPPPTDINPVIGIGCFSPNFSFINLIVHDHTRSGIYISGISTNTLVYGCVVYNNGWASPDNAEGHSFYVQSNIGTRVLADNVAFNAAGANFHIYESHSGGRLMGVTLDGNVAFHAGALQAVRRYADWIVGVDAPAIQADGIVLKNNMAYLPPALAAADQVQIGREGINGSVAILNNYLPLGLVLNNWTNAVVSGNFLAAQTANPIVQLNQTQTSLAAAWDGNSYWGLKTGRDFQSNSIQYDFSEWQQATGYDGNSTHTVGSLAGTKVFVRPNQYEAGRAHIIVYNWDNLASVPVDVGSVVPVGASYQVFNVQNLSAPPLLSGVFEGKPLLLPTTGLTVAAPNGPLLTPPPTGPTFNVFVLLPCRARLGIRQVTNAVEVSWPTNSGPSVLQSRDGWSLTNAWTDVEPAPELRGGQYAVTNSMTATARFYRLRSR